jgi:branched-chain amino acid transport system permease protein
MIGVMLSRPRGIWPPPEHGKAAPVPAGATTTKPAATFASAAALPSIVTKEHTA